MEKTDYKILVIIFIISLIFYGLTLAPTVLWGDDAQYQRLANSWSVKMIPRGHILYSYLVKIVNIIPYFKLAAKVNFFSALWASLTLVLLFLIIFFITHDKFSSLLGIVIFGLSHTFWLHAVRAEVHTLQLFLIASSLYLLLKWYKSNGKGLLFFSFLIIGISLCNHILSVGLIPAMLFLVLKKSPNLKLSIITATLGLMPGILILLFIRTDSISVFKILGDIFFEHNFPILKNLLLFILFLIYQFIISIYFGIQGIKSLYEQNKLIFYFLSFTFLGNLLEVIILPIHDQYVMFLPAFFVFAIFVGMGISWLFKKYRMNIFKKISFTVLISLILIITYWGTPIFLKHFKINIINIRSLPNRDNFTFFLFPPKNSYYGAYDFAQITLGNLPMRSVILADFTIAQPLLYLQEVENFRRDIEIRDIEPKGGKQTQYLLEKNKTHSVFIADNNKYYSIEEFKEYFEIIPFGDIYQLNKIF
ncbi:MAG: DUF2723 domain-containing protein [Candidatus Cloacimonadota bacterium]|nr:DUF2723 domain-containing protein [Candidatus Cloacimonadota bacterium]